MYKNLCAILIFILSIYSCIKAQNSGLKSSAQQYNSITAFKFQLESISKLSSSVERGKEISTLWEQLVLQHRIPLIIGDSVLFLFRGKANNVVWAGDFNGWDPGDTSSKGRMVANTDIWLMEKVFPSTARLDYKIVADNNWINDTANPNIQYSGFGPNSELRMPGWRYPDCTISRANIAHGQLSNNISFQSKI